MQIQEVNLTAFDAKRDRWNGYDAKEYAKVCGVQTDSCYSYEMIKMPGSTVGGALSAATAQQQQLPS
jgi:hypothetical protein